MAFQAAVLKPVAQFFDEGDFRLFKGLEGEVRLFGKERDDIEKIDVGNRPEFLERDWSIAMEVDKFERFLHGKRSARIIGEKLAVGKKFQARFGINRVKDIVMRFLSEKKTCDTCTPEQLHKLHHTDP